MTTNAADTKAKWLQELLDSPTLWEMLSSTDPENIILAAGLVAGEGSEEDSINVTKMVQKLLDATTIGYSRLYAERNETVKKGITAGLAAMQAAIIELSCKSWIDPVTVLGAHLNEVTDQDLNDAL